MLRWLRLTPPAPSADSALAALEREARAATDQARGHLFNRCGDQCAAAGQAGRAVRFYGEAVDAYLGAGYVGPAAAMCRKILRIAPEAVRTHCTLACLAAHEHQTDEALREIDRFVEASRRTRTEKLAVARLRLVGEAVVDEALRRRVAARLAEMGDALGAERILTRMREEIPGTIAPGGWERLLKAAALDPDELWKYA